MSKKEKIVPFEKHLNELETLVNEMETGELSLDQAMAHFEKGIKLTRECQQALKTAEQKVQLLLSKNGEETLEDFRSASDDPI